MISLTARRQILDLIVRPALQYIGLHSLAAEQLVMITAAHESGGFEYIAQVRGPALSWWQIEPDTYQDLIANTLPGLARSRPAIYTTYLELMRQSIFFASSTEQLAINPALACATCRLLYWRAPRALPAAFDWEAQADYWKTFYNTARGAGVRADYMAAAAACSDLWRAAA